MMKRWVPDYTNRSDTNLLANKPSSVTITEDGFICYRIKRYGNDFDAILRINNKMVTASCASTNAIADTSGVLPVFVGDVITYTYNTDTGDNYIYFIPGKWV